MDRRWFPARKCKRDDALGTWPCVGISRGPAPRASKPASTQFAKTGDPRIDRLAPSLVMVTFDMPYSVSGVTEKNYHGTGVIVDAERGLVAIDRNTVPVAMGDVRITFAGTVKCRARSCSFILCTIWRWCPTTRRSIGTTPVRAATLLNKTLERRRRCVGGGAARRLQDPVAADPGIQRGSRCRFRCRARCASATAIWRR